MTPLQLIAQDLTERGHPYSEPKTTPQSDIIVSRQRTPNPKTRTLLYHIATTPHIIHINIPHIPEKGQQGRCTKIDLTHPNSLQQLYTLLGVETE